MPITQVSVAVENQPGKLSEVCDILEKEEIGAERTVFHYIDGKDKELDILIERRTETVTYARFNVGWFGSRVLGRLMVRQIVFELAEADAFLRNWRPAEDD